METINSKLVKDLKTIGYQDKFTQPYELCYACTHFITPICTTSDPMGLLGLNLKAKVQQSQSSDADTLDIILEFRDKHDASVKFFLSQSSF